MTSIAIQDLKRPRELRDMLTQEHEVFVTKDGHPFAIMVGIDADSADDTLREVRRALFSSVILRARRRAREKPITEAEIASEVNAARSERSK
jgi:hypothetical protein